MPEQTLKPCPFCGGEGTEIGHIVHCQECMATAHGDGWNERVEEDTNEVIAVQLLMADGQTLTLPADVVGRTVEPVCVGSADATGGNIMADPPPITKPNGMNIKSKKAKAKTKPNDTPLKHILSDWIGSEGISVVKAARMTDLSEPTIYNLLNGSKPSPQTLAKLAAVVPEIEA